MEIHIVHDGAELGPFTEAAVQGLLDDRKVTREDLAWRPGMSTWAPLASLLAPARESMPPPSPGAASAGVAAAPALAVEPATEKQKALLAYMSIPFTPEITREAASLLVADAMENPKDPLRLARWNRERLTLHPDLFAAEVQARKESRAQQFLEICQQEGAAFFPKITKAHCQVLVTYLDVRFPNWDADEGRAAERYFFPAVAEKFPQLLTHAAKGRFDFPDGAKPSAGPPRAAVANARPRSRSGWPVGALVRGIVLGMLILGLLWLAKNWPNNPRRLPAMLGLGSRAKADSAAVPMPSPAGGKALPSPAARGEIAEVPGKKRKLKATPETAPQMATGPQNAMTTSAPPLEKAPAAPEAAAAPSPVPAMPEAAAITPGLAAAPPPAAMPATGEASTTGSVRPSLFGDLPTNPANPAAAPGGAGELIPATPARASLVVTKPVEIALAYGKIQIPAGTPVKMLQQSGDKVTIQYLNNTATIPSSSTNLGTEAAGSPPPPAAQ